MSIRNVGKWLGRSGVVCVLVSAWFCLSGCRTQSPEQQFAEVPPSLSGSSGASLGVTSASKPTADSAMVPVAATPHTAVATTSAPMASSAPASSSGLETDHLLRVGDTLTVTLTDTPVTIPTFQGPIGDDGSITLTLNQTFKAAGKSPGDLAKDIREGYVPRYYKYMTVSVNQLDSTRWYYVDGEVRTPNRQIYNSRITVLKAIASAGGFTDFAKKTKVIVTRVDGRTQIINCTKALSNPALDLEIYPGDKIHIPRKLW
jgi:protein involved in polysaccharide export with SLBB domain